MNSRVSGQCLYIIVISVLPNTGDLWTHKPWTASYIMRSLYMAIHGDETWSWDPAWIPVMLCLWLIRLVTLAFTKTGRCFVRLKLSHIAGLCLQLYDLSHPCGTRTYDMFRLTEHITLYTSTHIIKYNPFSKSSMCKIYRYITIL